MLYLVPSRLLWSPIAVILPLLKGMLVNEIVRLNSQVDGLLLQDVTVLGVPSPPHHVLVNDIPIVDFSYRLDSKVTSSVGAEAAACSLYITKGYSRRPAYRVSCHNS